MLNFVEGPRGAGIRLAALLSMMVLWLPIIEPAIAGSPAPAAGVSLELAKARATKVSDLVYDLDFTVPSVKEDPIRGKAIISMVIRGAGPLVLDFEGPREHVKSVRLLESGDLERSGRIGS